MQQPVPGITAFTLKLADVIRFRTRKYDHAPSALGGFYFYPLGPSLTSTLIKEDIKKKYSTLKINRDNGIEIPDGSLPKN